MASLSSISTDVFLAEWLPQLPQAGHVKEADAAAWLDSVLQNDPARFEWHFKRLFGLGGSDIGEVAAWRLGVPNLYKTPRDIVAAKLLKVGVEPSTPVMRRGAYLEPIIQRIFCEDFGGTSRPDLRVEVELQADPDHLWMRGNLDDVVEINGNIYIVDYKSSGKLPSSVPLQYACQLAQYDYLFERAFGVGSSGLLICYFDNATGLSVPMEIPGISGITLEELRAGVLQGGDEIWQNVLEGVFPDPWAYTPEKKEIAYTPQEKEAVSELEGNFTKYKVLADAAYAKSKAAQEHMEKILTRDGSLSLKGAKLPVDYLTTTVRQNFDETSALAILKNAGLDPSEFHVDGKLDREKVYTYCDDNHIARPVSESFSMSLRANSRLPRETLNFVKERASAGISNAAEQLEKELEEDELEEKASARM